MENSTEVFGWGSDHKGQLGLGSQGPFKTYSSPRFCSFNISIQEISSGEDFCGFISDSGHVYSIGSNTNGKLGVGDKNLSYSSSPCLVEALAGYTSCKISCGYAHTGIITSEGLLFTWGFGEYGALGTGDCANQWIPVQVSENVEDISCGARHSGIISKNSVFMCGEGNAGQLGTGKRQKETRFVKIESQNPIKIDCGEFHTGFITENSCLYMMGGNSFGQLGIGNKKSMVLPVKVNIFNVLQVKCGNYTACITTNGFYVWGNSVFGEFLEPKKVKISSKGIVDFDLGGSFGIAVDEEHKVFAWGNNSNGELGIGNYSAKTGPVLVSALKHKKVKKIAAGGNFCICLGETMLETTQKTSETLENYKNTIEPSNLELLLQEEKTKNSKLCKELDDMHKIHVELKESLQNKLQESNNHYHFITSETFKLKDCLNEANQQVHSLKSENLRMKDEVLRLKKIVEASNSNFKAEIEISKLKEAHYNEIQQLHACLDKEKVLKKQVERDLEVAFSHKNRLEAALAQVHNHLEDENSSNKHKLLQKIENLLKEKENVEILLRKTEEQVEGLQEDIEIMLKENSFYDKNNRDLSEKLGILNKHLQDLQFSLDFNLKKIEDKEFVIKSLNDENFALKNQILHLEQKNKDFIDKVVFDKAKDYKEKTLNLLNTQKPLHFKENLLKFENFDEKLRKAESFNEEVLSRRDLQASQKERIDNAVKKLIENTSRDSPLKDLRISSPLIKSPEDFGYRTGGFTFRKSATPSKDDIKSKIASLMQNRSRIEKKLQVLKDEQENL